MPAPRHLRADTATGSKCVFPRPTVWLPRPGQYTRTHAPRVSRDRLSAADRTIGSLKPSQAPPAPPTPRSSWSSLLRLHVSDNCSPLGQGDATGYSPPCVSPILERCVAELIVPKLEMHSMVVFE